MLVMDLTTTGMQISDRQESSAMSFLAWIVLGLVAGFIVSNILNQTGEDRRRDCLLGVVGAMVGGFLSNLVGNRGDAGLDFYSLLVALVGAMVFMIVYHAMFRRKRFLDMR